MFSFFKSDDGMKIQFNKEWDSYLVVKGKSRIVYTGSKEKCKAFMKNHVIE